MQYSVSAAARLTGIPANTLRTWERRYGVPRPHRSESGRRLYDDGDLEAIRRMAELIELGVPPAQAAASALIVEPGARPAVASAEPLHPGAERLLEAAAHFDEVGARATIGAAVEALGWGQALEARLFPALREMGIRWQRGEASVAQEHFLTQAIRTELIGALSDAPLPSGGPPILLACPEHERHELGVLALWLLLRQIAAPVICLGANVPADELVTAAVQSECDVVCLSVATSASLPHAGLAARALVRARRSVRVFIGGPALLAAGGAEPAPGIRLPQSITEAAESLVAAAGSLRRAEGPGSQAI